MEGGRCAGHGLPEIRKIVRHVNAVFEVSREVDPAPPIDFREMAVTPGEWTPPGYEFLGHGADRIAFGLCGEHVLKVDPYWHSSNLNEVAAWKGVDGATRERLAPVLASGRASKCHWLLTRRLREIAGMATEKDEFCARFSVVADLDPEAVRELDGRWVLMDYGTYYADEEVNGRLLKPRDIRYSEGALEKSL